MIKNGYRCAIVLLAVLVLPWVFGCDAHRERLIGPYELVAIDTEDQMQVAYDLGNGDSVGRIPATVFSVGFNNRYLVAKQHPNGNRSVTTYWYLEIDRDKKYADSKESVRGPMDLKEFERESFQKGFPEFSITIKGLE
jgi:hypothetical protein